MWQKYFEYRKSIREKRRMSELFGVSGQNMSFEDQKWIANWHAVLGINFLLNI